jgi:hypothetical protein
MFETQRPLHAVPGWVTLLLVLAASAQCAMVALGARPIARGVDLDPPPVGPTRALMRAFEPIPTGQLSALYLQAFDNQPGISIPFRDLDYTRVRAWLSLVLELDPVGQYPLLMASQLYAQVPDPDRSRLMLEFVHDRFDADPERRWPWLAHAAIMAKHRLHDLPMALRFARAIARSAKTAPAWARQMHIFLLEDMGEFEAARILLGGLLASGTVTDSHEKILLLERLDELKHAENSSHPTKR